MLAEGGGVVRDSGKVTHTLLYLKQMTSSDPLHSAGNSAPGSAPAWVGGELLREWICACARLSPFAVHLELPQRCELTTLQHEIKRQKLCFISRRPSPSSLSPWSPGTIVILIPISKNKNLLLLAKLMAAHYCSVSKCDAYKVGLS